MKVKLTTNLGSHDYPWAFQKKDGKLETYLEGEVREVPDEEAAKMFKRGHAIEVTAETERADAERAAAAEKAMKAREKGEVDPNASDRQRVEADVAAREKAMADEEARNQARIDAEAQTKANAEAAAKAAEAQAKERAKGHK